MLLQWFKLTTEKIRELFSRHRKSPNGTWKNYYFEIQAYFEGWLNELKIDSFDGLKNLMIADHMKKRCSPECNEHYLDIWEELISPEMLTDKLEAFDNIQRSRPSGPRRHVKASETVNDGRQVSFRKHERPPKREYSHQVPNDRSPLRCYGCGKQGLIKSRYTTCNLNASKRTEVANNHINAYTARIRSPRLTLIDITFCGIKGRVCADTGYSHSISGERMFKIFKDKGLLFQETTLAMSLADGQQTTGEGLTTQVMVEIEGRSVLAKFIILPKAKGNRTLLGTDFLSSAGLVLDVKNTCWYFWDNPTHKYPFGEELDTLYIVETMSRNTCQLREGEGGEATNILEHHINTGNNPPISVLPYRMFPVKTCPDCIKYKASNQKPSGVLQAPVPAQRFETLTIDLFGTLPESKDGKRWILIIEDCATKWTILFALPNATAKECAIILIEDVLLRSDKLPFIRFALNTAKCETTGQTAALLNFGRELRTPSEVVNDIRIREVVKEQQYSRKFYADKKRKAAPTYQPGEHVFVASRPLSNAAQGRSAKLMPRRDGPYVILTRRSPSSYKIASLDNPGAPHGVYHTSALTPCNNDKVKPLIPLRKRGRPPKVPQTPGSWSGRRRNQR
ncbi:transposon Tf2-8 polyprotein [Trichonephila clavipes]|uniref:Transposon Tf2-8 polyprotein n=1 Tax=Trichonephila clavipes TaxID=2585209 RepID=A0A8X6RSD1_TRICX|nr:transposon Tf2-8 polyprotein [Trichonephila clavipes]